MKKKLIVLVCLSILIVGCKNQVTTLPAKEENNEVVSEKEKLYKADFCYNENYYYFKGLVDYDVLKEIMKYLVVLQD